MRAREPVKISFLSTQNTLSGGHRIVYELANRLAERRHTISIYYPIVPLPIYLRVKSLQELKGFLRNVQMQLIAGRPNWCEVKVPLIKIPWISPLWIPDADVLVAPQWDLLWTIRDFPARKGVKVHYIHDSYRIFGKWKDLARKVWELPQFRIVTHRQLQEEARSLGLKTEYAPNGIDLTSFRMIEPLEKRDPYTVAMLYSNGLRKGLEDGFKVLTEIHRVYPRLRVLLFGSTKFKHSLAPWMEWRGQVSHEELIKIYNQAALFLCPSLYEGWGLPGFEAMACGCALVSTRHDGVSEYAEHEVSALLAPVGDVETLASHICRLISDEALRIRIARKGMESVQRFTWERSVYLFEQALSKALKAA